MFNNMSLSDEEVLKIIEDYKPLTDSRSYVNRKFDEDLNQDIKYFIYKKLTRNRKR